MAATLEQLVNVRSQLAVAVLKYLTQLANKLDQTDWWRGSERINASEIAVEPFVFTMRKRERPARSGSDREGREMEVERRSPMDEIDAERYELPVKVEEREEERWRQVIRRGRVRLGLKGAPGSGKTFSTRQTLVALAREAVAQLEQQQVNVEEVEFPVWVPAKNLAQTGAREIEEALIEALENGLAMKLSPNLRTWLKREIVSARAFIVVDALDELMESDRAPFEAKAKQLDGLNARVIATCRTMHWEERKGWLGWGSLIEVELAPFKRRQQREFTGRFFERQPNLRQNMERLLQVNFALRHACTTPLLLTFACLLHEEGKVNESTSNAALYAQMGRLMFSGRWRGVKPDWTSSRVREESCWRFFEDIAWRLFAKAPQLNRFTLDDWKQSAQQATESGAAAPLDATAFLEVLEGVGIVVPAGFDEQRADLCWSFAHRTFLEFLAARALSRMGQQVWLAEAKQHFWFQPEWLEVLTFLVGLVDDATPLIKAIDREGDDLFRSMLYMKARLVGAAGKVEGPVLRRVCDEVVSFCFGTSSRFLLKFALLMFTVLARNGEARGITFGSVLERTRDQDRSVRMVAAKALSSIGDERAVNRLLELTRSDAALEAIKALGSFSNVKVTNKLLELTMDADWFVRRAAAKALGNLREARAVDRLLELTKDWQVRVTAIEAIGNISDVRAVDRLLELTKEGYDGSVDVGRVAASALGKISDAKVMGKLLELTMNTHLNVCCGAVKALGIVGDATVVGRLLELTSDEEINLRSEAAEALGSIGDARVIDKLLELTKDKNSHVRSSAVKGLRSIGGGANVVDRLLELSVDRDSIVRHNAVEAVGSISEEWVIDRLLEWSSLSGDENWGMRYEALRALGRFGDERVVNKLLGWTIMPGGYYADEYKDLCRAAVESLGNIGDERAIDRLLWLMTSTGYWDIHRAAERALWQISWKKKVQIRIQS